jgi:hypothetical protein
MCGEPSRVATIGLGFSGVRAAIELCDRLSEDFRMTERRGRCLCGAVRLTAQEVPDTVGICHCELCRRWTGSALIGVEIPRENVTWEGVEHIAERQTTSWAKRGWCRECGSNLYVEFTGEGDYAGKIELSLGIFDDPNGFKISHETYVDKKCDSFGYGEGEWKKLTRKECVERLPILDSE